MQEITSVPDRIHRYIVDEKSSLPTSGLFLIIILISSIGAILFWCYEKKLVTDITLNTTLLGSIGAIEDTLSRISIPNESSRF